MEGNKGFTNIGNTCYMNSALQCLIHLPQLNPRTDIFKENIKKSTKKEYNLLKQWIQLYKEMWDSDSENNVIQTLPFLRKFVSGCNEENIYFEVFSQNDVSEFLNGFITLLHEEICRSVTITPSGVAKNVMDNFQLKSIETWNKFFNEKYSFIIKDFHSQALNMTCCPKCKYNTINLDPLLIISLDIDNSTNNIYDCLNNYTDDFEVDDDNKWKCDNCNELVNCEKKNKFWKLSDILIILIKQYDTKNKINKFIEYPDTLNMEAYCFNYKNESMNYELQSMCIHSGSLGGGHYYAYCKNYIDNMWREYNDTNVKQIAEENVMKQKPYCLFYKRIEASD